MFFTFVPALMFFGAPYTGKSLITITESPFCKTAPFESNTTFSLLADSLSSIVHSNEHQDTCIDYPLWHIHIGIDKTDILLILLTSDYANF
jgi:hypothetical protein